MSIFSHHNLPFAFHPGVAFQYTSRRASESDKEARRNTSANHESLGRKSLHQTGGTPGYIAAGEANSPDDTAYIEGFVVAGPCGHLWRPPRNPVAQSLKRKYIQSCPNDSEPDPRLKQQASVKARKTQKSDNASHDLLTRRFFRN